MQESKVYKELEKEYNTLKDKKLDIVKFFETYILREVEDKDLLSIFKKNGMSKEGLSPLDYLDNEAVKIQTIRIITLLQLSETWNSFHNKFRKLSKPKVEIDFVKVIKGITKK